MDSETFDPASEKNFAIRPDAFVGEVSHRQKIRLRHQCSVCMWEMSSVTCRWSGGNVGMWRFFAGWWTCWHFFQQQTSACQRVASPTFGADADEQPSNTAVGTAQGWTGGGRSRARTCNVASRVDQNAEFRTPRSCQSLQPSSGSRVVQCHGAPFPAKQKRLKRRKAQCAYPCHWYTQKKSSHHECVQSRVKQNKLRARRVLKNWHRHDKLIQTTSRTVHVHQAWPFANMGKDCWCGEGRQTIARWTRWRQTVWYFSRTGRSKTQKPKPQQQWSTNGWVSDLRCQMLRVRFYERKQTCRPELHGVLATLQNDRFVHFPYTNYFPSSDPHHDNQIHPDTRPNTWIGRPWLFYSNVVVLRRLTFPQAVCPTYILPFPQQKINTKTWHAISLGSNLLSGMDSDIPFGMGFGVPAVDSDLLPDINSDILSDVNFYIPFDVFMFDVEFDRLPDMNSNNFWL